MRRWLLINFPLAALLALGFLLSSLETPRVTRANFERLKEGMPWAEVETLLGPQSASVTSELFTAFYTQRTVEYSEDRTGLLPANTIRVEFTNDKVVKGTFRPWTAADWWRQLRRRLGL